MRQNVVRFLYLAPRAFDEMESSVLLSVLILGLSFVLECKFTAAHALQEADSRSTAATLFELFIEELYELHFENKIMAEKVELLEGKLRKMNESQNENEIMAEIDKTLEVKLGDLNKLQNEHRIMAEKVDRLEGKLQELKALPNENKMMMEKIEMLEEKLELLASAAGAHVGFTVTGLNDNTDPFYTVLYNSEQGFNTATGKFVCQSPGMYLFTATVVRKNTTNEASCYMTVNGSTKLRVFAYNSTRSGYPSGSGTLVAHLSTGDEVYLLGCLRSNLYSESSFSGILIQPDVD